MCMGIYMVCAHVKTSVGNPVQSQHCKNQTMNFTVCHSNDASDITNGRNALNLMCKCHTMKE